MKYVKGKKVGAGKDEQGARALSPKLLSHEPPPISSNPWIDRRLFNLMRDRAVAAENMCKDLIRIIAVDDGEFLAGHDYDYLAAGEAIKRGEI